jgi:hypothetical protein
MYIYSFVGDAENQTAETKGLLEASTNAVQMLKVGQ